MTTLTLLQLILLSQVSNTPLMWISWVNFFPNGALFWLLSSDHMFWNIWVLIPRLVSLQELVNFELYINPSISHLISYQASTLALKCSSSKYSSIQVFIEDQGFKCSSNWRSLSSRCSLIHSRSFVASSTSIHLHLFGPNLFVK